MRMRYFFRIVFSVLSVLVSTVQTHNSSSSHSSCNHDIDPVMQAFYEEYEKEIFSESKKRFLGLDSSVANSTNGSTTTQSSNQTALPLRVTYDSTALDNSSQGITSTQKSYILSLVASVQNFLKNFIKVIRFEGNNILTFKSQSANQCLEAYVPAQDKTIGIADSDLHLYIRYDNTDSNSFVATAGWCYIYQSARIVRPTFGTINFNIAKMQFNPYDLNQYQSNLMVVVHEIIHVLGFSSYSLRYWVNKSTKQFIKAKGVAEISETRIIRSLNTTLIKSPNLLATARQYFGCASFPGMPLENQGTSASIGSHFERTAIGNELMTASTLLTGMNLSIFTAAVLRDTGFWDEINENLTDPIWWGKNKGCDFLQYDCRSPQDSRFEEFSPEGNESCSFQADGFGNSSAESFSDGCPYVRPYTNVLCEDPDAAQDSYNSKRMLMLSEYSYNSRCFLAQIKHPLSKEKFESNKTRCLKYQCAADNSMISISSSYLSGFSFICSSSDAGQSKTAYFNTFPIGTITCPTNYERFCENRNCKNYCSKNGVCVRGMCFCNPGSSGEDCSLKCAMYSENNRCTDKCSYGKYANPDNTCKSTCPKGYYKNDTEGVCAQCDYSCSLCTGPSSNECTACQSLTFLDGSKCVAECPVGKWENLKTRKCSSCPFGCVDCTSDSVCGTCKTDYEKSAKNSNLCTVRTCDAPCATCKGSSTICTSCMNDAISRSKRSSDSSSDTLLYLDRSKLKCVESTECPKGTFANETTQKCNSCSTGCVSCTSSNVCLKCDDTLGYRLSGNSCTLCSEECSKCDPKEKSACLLCENAMYTLKSKCVMNCPSGFYNGPNYQCIPCSTGCTSCTSPLYCNVCDEEAGYKKYTFNAITTTTTTTEGAEEAATAVTTLTANSICVLETECFSPCKTCTNHYEPEICETCESGLVLQGTTCKTSCDYGYFYNSDLVCMPCDLTQCSTCSRSPSQCTSCPIPLLLNEGFCVESCPTGASVIERVCYSKQNQSAYSYESRLILEHMLVAQILLIILLL